MSYSSPQLVVPPFTHVIKRIVIISTAVWLLGVVILQRHFLDQNLVFEYLGLKPASALFQFFVWQPLTYIFIHSLNPMHIIFNMLSLWMFGAELEQRLGHRTFLAFFLFCGAGAGILYTGVVGIYSLLSGNPLPLSVPVVGASGAVFGVMYAYARFFGDRMVSFMMIFPMKAKFLVALIGGIQVIMFINEGFGSDVSALSHLGGLLMGYIFFKIIYGSGGGAPGNRPRQQKNRRNLKLVVSNSSLDQAESSKTRYWN